MKNVEKEGLLGSRHEECEVKSRDVHRRARKLGFTKQEVAALKRLYAKVLNKPVVGD